MTESLFCMGRIVNALNTEAEDSIIVVSDLDIVFYRPVVPVLWYYMENCGSEQCYDIVFQVELALCPFCIAPRHFAPACARSEL